MILLSVFTILWFVGCISINALVTVFAISGMVPGVVYTVCRYSGSPNEDLSNLLRMTNSWFYSAQLRGRYSACNFGVCLRSSYGCSVRSGTRTTIKFIKRHKPFSTTHLTHKSYASCWLILDERLDKRFCQLDSILGFLQLIPLLQNSDNDFNFNVQITELKWSAHSSTKKQRMNARVPHHHYLVSPIRPFMY